MSFTEVAQTYVILLQMTALSIPSVRGITVLHGTDKHDFQQFVLNWRNNHLAWKTCNKCRTFHQKLGIQHISV